MTQELDDLNELDELAAANPVLVGQLTEALAIDPESLRQALEADDQANSQAGNQASPGRASILRLPSGPGARIGYVGAGLLVAAGFAAIGLATANNLPDEVAVTDPAASPDDGTGPTEPPPTPSSTIVLSDPSEPATAEADPSVAPNQESDDTDSTGADTDTGTDQPPASTNPPSLTPTPNGDDPGPTDRPEIDGPFRPEIDLLSLHYEHAPNRDDALAAVAGRQVTSWLGVEAHVVGGAYGGDNQRRYNPDSEPVMDAAWGADRWVNAHADWDQAVSVTAAQWLAALDDGGQVWVAEGGQSDFTADVVREIRRLRPTLETNELVHVVQHSRANELASTTDDLEYVQANTDYIKIDDGNHPNGTADLQKDSSEFEAAAVAGGHGAAWEAAFAYFPDAVTLDFSDTVELLHILGIGLDQVANPTDFASTFFN